MKPAITDETLALIEDTELVVTKELPIIQTALIVSRVLDQAGQPIPRRFTCSADVLGEIISCTAGNKYAAHSGLQKQIRLLGWEPQWNAVRDLTDADEDTEVPVVEPVYVAPRIVPGMEPETLHTPADESEEPGEHENPEHGLTTYMPVLDKTGWLTPLSDPLAYRRIYLAAWSLATGLSAYASDRTLVANRDIQNSVAAVMMSGDAGASIGIPAIAVNPWALGTNGTQEMLWVRVTPKTPDPTTAPFRSGMGPAREAHLLTLSGLPAFPEKARMWQEKREARQFAGAKGANTVGQKAERTSKRLQAHKAGSAAKTIAYNDGADEVTADLHYKWVYAATLRNLGEIHSVYEAQLLEHGITEEMILGYAAQQQRKTA